MMKYIAQLIIISLFLCSCSPKEKVPFEDGLGDYPVLKNVLENVDKYQVQIIYSRIERNEHGNALMTDFTVNLDDTRYFYPASTVKLPVALLALEWLEEQNIEGLTAETTMLTDSVRPSQIPAFVDYSAKDSLPSIAHYIKKILLVSDNDAYNRLYELLGQDYINQKLVEKGLGHTIINHRLSYVASPEENRIVNPIRFVDSTGNVILELPERRTETTYSNVDNPTIGNVYYEGGSLVNHSMDFTFKNKLALSDLHGIVKRTIFPMSFVEFDRFAINEAHRNFVLKYMSMLPAESDFPKYPKSEYWDRYSKFYLDGNDKSDFPANIRIFNKTGEAYGHLIDASYYVDFEKGIEFFVSAVIYANEDERLNDNLYEYDEIGFPFFAELGDYLYQLESERKKMIPKDLKKFKFEYQEN
ncbi:serine hydrolase [Algoriphagus chordae]|uniref:Beta-lactamase family protein n=1 Tax=Algoriphagus chordae TaxID=237019 RepID=A0A2W7RFJ6_9BACT|nr:serine hydrolase [Algoriphagus chordae]PZX57896.1 beta-lactamase family protein [Algoriphagus chordae]